MKKVRNIAILVFAAAIVIAVSGLQAHQGGAGSFSDQMIVTRHFTGIWDQVDHEAQGIALQVVEQLDDSRKAVAYWYTYGADRRTAWYMGIGELEENRIDFELFDSTNVGFLQEGAMGNDSVTSIGTMTIEFGSCQSGEVTYATSHEDVGSGSFVIERILEVMNTHCTGGISDDMHADGMFGEQRLELSSAREGVSGSGHARYQDYPAHMEFNVEVEDLPDGIYHLHIGGHGRGDIEVMGGHGEVRFSSPAEDGHMLMNFDPRGMQIEVHDGQGVVLSTFDRRFSQDQHSHQGGGHGDGDHAYDCDSGHMGGGGMGGGRRECVDDGDFVEIEAELQNTGVLPDAEGEAEWEMNSERVRFSVEIEDVQQGDYLLRVAGQVVGVIETFEMHNGEVFGRIGFRDPAVYGMEPLAFEPRGQKIEVLLDDTVILEVEFPSE